MRDRSHISPERSARRTKKKSKVTTNNGQPAPTRDKGDGGKKGKKNGTGGRRREPARNEQLIFSGLPPS